MYADNMALPAFTHCMPLLQQSIDISCPLGPQQQTCSSSVRRLDGTDRQTDGQTESVTIPFHKHGSTYYADSAKNWFSAGRAILAVVTVGLICQLAEPCTELMNGTKSKSLTAAQYSKPCKNNCCQQHKDIVTRMWVTTNDDLPYATTDAFNSHQKTFKTTYP